MYIDNNTDPLTADDITKLSKTHQVAVANNQINIGNNNKTKMPQVLQRELNATMWIRSNPPQHLEKTSVYHARYMQNNPKGCADNKFGAVMKAENYKAKITYNGRFWINTAISTKHVTRDKSNEPAICKMDNIERPVVDKIDNIEQPVVDKIDNIEPQVIKNKFSKHIINKIKPRVIMDKFNKHVVGKIDNIKQQIIKNPYNNAEYAHVLSCKTESKLLNILSPYYEIERQFKPEWCINSKTKRHLPFDFVIKANKIIIELDGNQHFVQVKNWLSPKETQQNDLFKMRKANTNGYSVIRLLQMDVWNNTNNWLTILRNVIQTIVDNKVVVNKFIARGNEYSNYMLELGM
jgi:very-short-patch-repair endonuclease